MEAVLVIFSALARPTVPFVILALLTMTFVRLPAYVYLATYMGVTLAFLLVFYIMACSFFAAGVGYIAIRFINYILARFPSFSAGPMPYLFRLALIIVFPLSPCIIVAVLWWMHSGVNLRIAMYLAPVASLVLIYPLRLVIPISDRYAATLGNPFIPIASLGRSISQTFTNNMDNLQRDPITILSWSINVCALVWLPTRNILQIEFSDIFGEAFRAGSIGGFAAALGMAAYVFLKKPAQVPTAAAGSANPKQL
jgi:hypothetical protein